jgi:hypothetical protein
MTIFRSRTQDSYFVSNALQVFDLQGVFVWLLFFQKIHRVIGKVKALVGAVSAISAVALGL